LFTKWSHRRISFTSLAAIEAADEEEITGARLDRELNELLQA
jgi:hypothetical protein